MRIRVARAYLAMRSDGDHSHQNAHYDEYQSAQKEETNAQCVTEGGKSASSLIVYCVGGLPLSCWDGSPTCARGTIETVQTIKA